MLINHSASTVFPTKEIAGIAVAAHHRTYIIAIKNHQGGQMDKQPYKARLNQKKATVGMTCTMTAMAIPEYTHVELLTLNGPEYRRVSTAPPRLPSDDEIPVIDLVGIDGDLDARTVLAGKIRAAAQNTGFFYIKNHGMSEEMIAGALTQAKAFFHQPQEEKEKVSNFKLMHMDGYHAIGTTQVNKSETKGQPHN